MKRRQLDVEVTVVDGPINIDAWVDTYVRIVLANHSIPIASRESMERKPVTKGPLAS